MNSDTFDYLWEPFFDELGYELDEDEFEEGGYPGINTIERAVGDDTVAFFADELEDWFESLSGKREAANRGFLQALLEATSRTELFVFASTLREESEVHKILNREDRVEVNMSNQVDIRDVLRTDSSSLARSIPARSVKSSTATSARTPRPITSTSLPDCARRWRIPIPSIRNLSRR